jgi:hypothetical protein
MIYIKFVLIDSIFFLKKLFFTTVEKCCSSLQRKNLTRTVYNLATTRKRCCIKNRCHIYSIVNKVKGFPERFFNEQRLKSVVVDKRKPFSILDQ